jgi:RNA polymerase sigma-70 factor (ECF subfamily)
MASLLDRIKAGDSSAVREFYTATSPKLLRFLQRQLPRVEDAQEILNDIFFEAIDSLPLLYEDANLNAWLYRIARNKVADFYRKRKIKSLLLSQIPYIKLFTKELHDPEFQYEKKKIRERIEKTLTQLSERYQYILKMHYEEDIPVKDIAVELNLSFKATESLLFRARKEFQKVYERT